MKRKGNPCLLEMGVEIGVATVENSTEVPQKIINRKTCDPAIPRLGVYVKKTKTLPQNDTRSPMFTAALCTKAWKQPGCPPAGE